MALAGACGYTGGNAMSEVRIATQSAPSEDRPRRQILIEAENVLRDRLRKIQNVMDDEQVNEIMINTPTSVFIERAGKVSALDATFSDRAIESIINSIMRLNAKEADLIMDARLPGLRVAAAMPPVAIHGPMLVIRKHAKRRFTFDDYVRTGGFSRAAGVGGAVGDDTERAERMRHEGLAADGGEGLAEFLRWAVRSHKNILVVGGTSSGKTSLVSCLLSAIPDDERVITCEDTNELTLGQPNALQFEALPSISGRPAVTIRDLIRLCLRSRPDRIIVGEIRGPEAYDFLDSMNTGHSGSICTLHADSPFLGLRRLESLIRMSPTAANLPLGDMRSEISSAIHYVLYQARRDGARGTQEVLALDGVCKSPETGSVDYAHRTLFSRYGGVND